MVPDHHLLTADSRPLKDPVPQFDRICLIEYNTRAAYHIMRDIIVRAGTYIYERGCQHGNPGLRSGVCIRRLSGAERPHHNNS
jgi:hypothetical protein